LDIVVLSDLHLGTYGAHAEELLIYLNSIKPSVIILNGDIIDMWQFSKNYFPPSHFNVLKLLIEKMNEGAKVIYLTGNHDDLLRKLTDIRLGNLQVCNKLTLKINGKDHWFFHGDVFDASVNYAKWIAKLGGKGYDFLIRINRIINSILKKYGRPPKSFSKKIKNNIKNAVKYISDFEKTAAELAIENEFDYVICGHIHAPVIRQIKTAHGQVIYMNSGDWVENLTSLEFHEGHWKLFDFYAEASKNAADYSLDFRVSSYSPVS
jgi:UDP-2,3-diacylglucosamine pyrophosphatase LpxH